MSIDRAKHRLLVVNDDPIGRYTTVRQLESAGFPVIEAGTGAETLELANEELAAVVLDIHLPDIDGFEVARRLRAQSSTLRLPIIHLTAAYLSDEDKVRGLDAGADAYLTHPVEPAVLVSTIQALVRTRTAEDAMRRSEAKFRTVYDQTPSGIGLLECDTGRILDANPALMALLQRDAPALIGRRLGDFAAPAQATAPSDFVKALAGGAERAEFALLLPDGTTLPIEWSSAPHIEPGVCLAVATDLRPRIELARQRQALLDRERSARGEAEQLNRHKDDLIAVLSHELRTPLNAITGWTHVLRKQFGDSQATLARGLAAIERNVNLQARMISDILDMSRLNVGKLPLALERMAAGLIVDAAVSGVQTSFEASGHRLALELQGEELLLHADAGRIQQVLWNLLGNAAKFSPPGSRVTLAMKPQDQGLLFTVSDEGQGIAPDFLPHLFDRFAQGDAQSNRRHGGLGLGLAIVKNLVEAHGGHVAAHSRGPGQGSRFEVWLPLDGPAGPASPAQDSGPDSVSGTEITGEAPLASLHGLRVLVVDDDAEALSLLQLILGERGAAVTTADGYESALAVFEAMPALDLLISDIGMPDHDGYELLRELRHREAQRGLARHLPAIAFTAFSRESDRMQALSAGFDAHLGKPLKPLRLLQLVSQLWHS